MVVVVVTAGDGDAVTVTYWMETLVETLVAVDVTFCVTVETE
jgi:hypothetical protein